VPETIALTALTLDGGFFAYRYVDSPATIARLDADLSVVWQVVPETELGIEGGLAPPSNTLFAAAPDGGLALAGAAASGVRVIRLSSQGDELWRDDLGAGLIWESELAAGPGSEVVVTSMLPSAGGGSHGWIRLYAADGAPAWTIDCDGPRSFESLTMDATGVLVAGRLDHGVTNSRGFVAKFARSTADRSLAP